MDESLEETSATTDLQALRRQARQRFMGALVLVIVAVVVLPFVLDTKPRPVSPDIAIEIKSPTPPTNANPKPEPTPAAVVAPSPAASAPLAFPQAKEQNKENVATKPAVIAEPATKPDDGARAAALLNGSGYQIQAGSFTDKSKVQALQARLEKAGYSVQTQDAVGRDGLTYTRIRVGPYATQVDANAAASRISKLGIKTIVIKP